MKPTPAVQKKYDQSPKGKFRSYKESAKRRGIGFNLTIEEFKSFWQQPCFYCGYKIFTIGLDRTNSGPYEMGNITSCCSRCNAAKSDLTQAAFFELCRQVVLTHGLLPEPKCRHEPFRQGFNDQ